MTHRYLHTTCLLLEVQAPPENFTKCHVWSSDCWHQWQIPGDSGKVRFPFDFISILFLSILFSVLSSDRTRDNRYKLKHKKFLLNIAFLIILVPWFSKNKAPSTVRGTTKAVILSRMSYEADEGERKQTWRQKHEKSEAIAYLSVSLLYLGFLLAMLPVSLPVFFLSLLSLPWPCYPTISLTCLSPSYCKFFKVHLVIYIQFWLYSISSFCSLFSLPSPLLFLIIVVFLLQLHTLFSDTFYMTLAWCLCLRNNFPVSRISPDVDGQSFIPSVMELQAISYSKMN